MRRPVPRTIFTSYAVAWLYLVGFVASEVIYAALSPHDQAAVIGWASTNVHNLRHHPVGSLVASAFVTQSFATAWPALIALAMFGANRVLGNWRTALVCAAGHVAGTLVSEGIAGYRISRGLLPASSRYIIDVGPSYVVVSAIVVALLYGSWPARAAAALDLALLVFVGNIFGGLSQLDVAAVGHLTAMTVAAAGGSLLLWQLRRRQHRPLRQDPAGAPAGLTGPAGPSGSFATPPPSPDQAANSGSGARKAGTGSPPASSRRSLCVLEPPVWPARRAAVRYAEHCRHSGGRDCSERTFGDPAPDHHLSGHLQPSHLR